MIIQLNISFLVYDNTSQSKDEQERLKFVKAFLYDDMKLRCDKG